MTAERYALEYAAHGWPVLPAAPGGKLPLARHGVKDASTDANQIRRWWSRWPNANVAVACGRPGPQVLDIDNMTAAAEYVARFERVPCVATVRGRHYWFAGRVAGTVALDFGELRGRGSYVIAPPSVHESGREYVWLLAPYGPLPAPPKLGGHSAGAGDHEPPARPIIAGDGRWPYLRDFAVRLTRAGVTDPARLLAHIRAEFELSCVSDPPARSGALEALAAWASQTEIASRERRIDELTERLKAAKRDD